jgi:hypothetical protein
MHSIAMQSAGSERQSGWEPSDGSPKCRNDDRGGDGQFHAPTGVRISGVSPQTRRLNPLRSEQQCIATPYTVHEDFEPTFRAFWTHLGIVARVCWSIDRMVGPTERQVSVGEAVQTIKAGCRAPRTEPRDRVPEIDHIGSAFTVLHTLDRALFALQGTQWTGRASPNGSATG